MENWNPQPTKTLESLDAILSKIFVSYAEASDDDSANVEAGTDFTKFPWNVNSKKFVLDADAEKQIQDDANQLCILERDYKLHLATDKDTESREILQDRLSRIEKIFDKLKEIFPGVQISDNLRNH